MRLPGTREIADGLANVSQTGDDVIAAVKQMTAVFAVTFALVALVACVALVVAVSR